MKIQSYIIAVAILLPTFSSAANKAIADLGQVEIDDLFYNSGAPSINTGIEKFEFDQVDKILIKNEDLELESLEIADIDIATFGEYEAFLNKYYDDNYIDINSKFIRQLEFMSGGMIGQKMPFGKNAKSALKNGINIGVTLNDIYNFKYKNLNFTTNLAISYDSNQANNLNNNSNVQVLNIEPTLNLNLWKNIIIKTGLGLMSIKSAEPKEEGNINRIFGFSSFLELQYKINLYNNINLNIFSRAKMEKPTENLYLYNTNATVESLIFGMGLTLPLYLTY